MPSPASSTVPVSLTDTFWSNPSISRRMIWLISSARSSMAAFSFDARSVVVFRKGRRRGSTRLVQQAPPHLFQLSADAAVEHQVTHPGHQAPDERRIHTGHNYHLAAGPG